jgi:glyoxylase-like metal-dependent hydrolase (beta-lactamase superfamily II)
VSRFSADTGIFAQTGIARSFADGHFYFLPAFGNVGIIETPEDLLLFDIGTRQMGNLIFQGVRATSPKPVRTIVYSHGHFDHCFGYAPFVTEWTKQGWTPPAVIAHENVVRRFEKYRRLGPYHAWINGQQFGSLARGQAAQSASAADSLDPTICIKGWDPYKLAVGKYAVELHPAWGETDDMLWMYIPEGEVVFTGDLFLWSFPNVGNPFKVQRYPKQWAQALEEMTKLDLQYLAPGHGPLIEGRNNVHEALTITSEALNFVHDGVVERLNEGKWFEQIYWEMMDAFPVKFRKSPYIQPTYGCLQFAIHASYRLYHGWYATGNPTDLFPARQSRVMQEILFAAGPGAAKTYLSRARELITKGEQQLALHLLDIVIKGTPQNQGVEWDEAHTLKIKVLKEMARVEPSFIAKNIYLSALQDMQKEAKQKTRGATPSS